MNNSNSPITFVHVVSFNNDKTIAPCLDSILAQEGFTAWENLFVFVTDNNSSDNTASVIAEKYKDTVRLKRNSINTGFTGAHNAGLSFALSCNAEYIMLLNPDLRLEPDVLARLVRTLDSDPRVGMCCPKLLRCDEALNPLSPRIIDAAGMYITPAIRHFDRGSNQVDQGIYDKEEYVFGASGAAILMRRNFVLDTALPSSKPEDSLKLFDDSFFAYREDADLAWRAQWFGWKCRYVPQALGYHQRMVLPERRRSLPRELNAYSVRNRFLLQLNNFSFLANFRCLLKQTLRNLLVVGAACTIERSSFPALAAAFRLAPRALCNRRFILGRKRAHPLDVGKWFSQYPYTEPALSEHPSRKKISSLLITVINYNSGSRLGDCLQHLALAISRISGQIDVTVKIIDNASEDDSAARVEPVFRSLPQFNFHFSKTNLGYAGAINTARKGSSADALLILNPDILISDECILGLSKALDEHEQIAALSPVLYGEDGAIQFGFTVRSFPSIASTLAELFYLHRILPKNPWTQRYLLLNDSFLRTYLEQSAPNPEEPYENLELPLIVPQPAGACLMIRSTAFDSVQGFDSSFWPAWFEDVDFCKRLSDKDLLCAVLGSASATHEGGYSLQSLPAGRFAEIWYPNLLHYWKKHSKGLPYLTLRILLPIALLLRSFISFLDGVFPGIQEQTKINEKRTLSCTLFRLALSPLKRSLQKNPD